MQNGYIESFNGRMRDELLNESLFFGLDNARSAVAEWMEDYNTARPHSSLGYQTPAPFAEILMGADLPVAQPAPYGVIETVETLIASGKSAGHTISVGIFFGPRFATHRRRFSGEACLFSLAVSRKVR